MDKFIVLQKSTEDSLSRDEMLRFTFSANFARCLVSQRKKLGLTQEQLSELSGVSRVTIAQLEKYQRLAGTEVVLKLLDALNLDIHFVERQ